MLDAIVGDVIGSVYELKTLLPRNIPLLTADSRFTDDTVFNMAVADYHLNGAAFVSGVFRAWGSRHLGAGAGKNFAAWLASADAGPYQGETNGCLMRVSPAVALASSLEQAQEHALHTTAVSHDSAIAYTAVRTDTTQFYATLMAPCRRISLWQTPELHRDGSTRPRSHANGHQVGLYGV